MRILLAGILLVMFAGCCKVYCDGRNLGISFRKFKAGQTDTVIFISYMPNANFASKVDSFALISPVPPPYDTLPSSVSYSLSSAYDWRVTVPSVNRQFLLQNFQLTTERCSCGGNRYKSISSFTLNGATKSGLYLEVE